MSDDSGQKIPLYDVYKQMLDAGIYDPNDIELSLQRYKLLQVCTLLTDTEIVGFAGGYSAQVEISDMIHNAAKGDDSPLFQKLEVVRNKKKGTRKSSSDEHSRRNMARVLYEVFNGACGKRGAQTQILGVISKYSGIAKDTIRKAEPSGRDTDEPEGLKHARRQYSKLVSESASGELGNLFSNSTFPLLARVVCSEGKKEKHLNLLKELLDIKDKHS